MGVDAQRRKLEEAIAESEPYGPSDPDAPPVEVSAGLLRDLVRQELEASAGTKRLWLRGARVVDSLDLEAQRFQIGLRFERCQFDGPVNLRQARGSDIAFGKCRLEGGLRADQLDLRWNLLLLGMTANNGVSLTGAKIGGNLSLSDSTLAGVEGDEGEVGPALFADEVEIHGGMICDGLTTTGEVRLPGVRIGGSLSMDEAKLSGYQVGGARTSAFTANGIRIEGDLLCRHGFETLGETILFGAVIEGQLSLSGAKLDGGDGEDGQKNTALNADGVRVGRGLFCDEGVRADGELRFLHARVGGLMTLNGAVLDGGLDENKKPSDSLSADGIEVAGDVFCYGLVARGQVRFLGAKVGGNLGMNGAKLDGGGAPGGPLGNALSGDGAEIKEGVFCNEGFAARGAVRFPAVRVGAQMSMIGATLSVEGSRATSLILSAAEIDELIFGFQEVDGTLDLRNARVRSLWDTINDDFFGERPRNLQLDGFRYQSFREPLDAERRLDWIAASQERRHYPGVYAELADAFRRIGHRSDARKVGVANERRAREDLPRRSPRRLWHDFLWLTVGYGYRNWLAAVWLAAIIAIGAVVFYLGEDSFMPANLLAPPLEPFIYAVDTIVPVLDLSQTRWWSATGYMAWVELALAFLGYVLVAAVIAAAAGLFNRDQV